MFAYCGNNPVNFEDPNGEFFDRLWDNFVKKLNKAKSVFCCSWWHYNWIVQSLDQQILQVQQ